MRQLSYPEGSDKWIKPYHSAIFDRNKLGIAAIFKMSRDENIKCTIFVATNAYGIGIDNLNIKVIIQ